MRHRGGSNRRTGKTTPRNKVKTHWGKKARPSHPAASKNAGKTRGSGPAKA